MTTLTSERRRAADVRPLADELLAWLAPHCEQVQIGGSLRRNKLTVKDVELVVRNPKPSYFSELDAAVARGQIAKKRYGDKQTTRWGDGYRGLTFEGVTFELFTCDSDNAGYVFLLRTGPADANQYLVTQIKYGGAPFMLKDGYIWTAADYNAQKLSVPTEADFFALCGLPELAPEERAVERYKGYLGRKGHQWGNPTQYAIETRSEAQGALFDTGAAAVESREDTRARYRAECTFLARAMPRFYYGRAKRALAQGDTALARSLVARATATRRFWNERTGR